MCYVIWCIVSEAMSCMRLAKYEHNTSYMCCEPHTTVVGVVFLSHGVFESNTACCEAGVEDVVMATVANVLQVTTA